MPDEDAVKPRLPPTVLMIADGGMVRRTAMSLPAGSRHAASLRRHPARSDAAACGRHPALVIPQSSSPAERGLTVQQVNIGCPVRGPLSRSTTFRDHLTSRYSPAAGGPGGNRK